MNPTGAIADNIFALAEKQQKLIEEMVAEKRELATQLREFAGLAKNANAMLAVLTKERERLQGVLRQARQYVTGHVCAGQGGSVLVREMQTRKARRIVEQIDAVLNDQKEPSE